MMNVRKFLCIFFCFVMLCATVACTGGSGSQNTQPATTQGQTNPDESLTDAPSGTETTTQPETQPPEADTSPVTTSDETDTAPVNDTTAETDTAPVNDTTAESDTQPPEDPVEEGMRPSQEVRIMSMNLDANESTISNRAKDMIAVLTSYDPDSIGVQECRGSWVSRLNSGLKDYARVGVAADGNQEANSSFATYIFYKKDKYELVDSGTFWLSHTPEVPSIYGSTVDCNRTCTWAILKDKTTGFCYVHVNSHLDWMDVKATEFQMALIREQILRFEAMGLPVFATGDYNTNEGSNAYNIMLQATSVADAKFVAEKTMSLGTYPEYGHYDVTVEKPIDFCFVTKDVMNVVEYKVVEDQPQGKPISDHYPLFIHAKVTSLPDSYATATGPDISDLRPTVESVGTTVSVTIQTVGRDAPVPVINYTVTLKDPAGQTAAIRSMSSGYMDADAPETLTVTFFGLEPTTAYTVMISATNLFHKTTDSEPITATTGEAPAAEVVGQADLFDLSVDSDGNFVDASPCAMAITKQGNVTTGSDETGTYAGFNKNGCLKILSFKEKYSTLAQGFTAELYIRPDSVSGNTDFFANMHAGGFGYEVKDGQLMFHIHTGGSYKRAVCRIETGKLYHLVAVYDTQTLKLYVNGQLADTVTATGSMGFATDPGAQYLCVGADSDASGAGEYFCDADIYIARIYSTPLTEGQVRTLWQSVQ